MRQILRNPHHNGSYLKSFSLLFMAGWLAACAPSKAVYIPPDWQTSPPKTEVSEQPKEQLARPVPPQQPILKAPAQIKEMDVSQSSNEATSASSGSSPASPARVSDDPQYLASMHLVDQAKASLARGDADNAIAPLEQAIQVDVYNGEAFFGLARAWKMKGSQGEALEFASKAEILFQDNPKKLKEVYLLKADLYKELQDPSKAEYYLNKAARLE